MKDDKNYEEDDDETSEAVSRRKSLFDDASVRSRKPEKLSKEDAMGMVLSASIIKKKEWER